MNAILSILYGIIATVVVLLAERIWKKYIKNTKYVQVLGNFKTVLIHIIISAVIWDLGQRYSTISTAKIFKYKVDTRIIYAIMIVVINIMIWLSRKRYSQVNGGRYIKGKVEHDNELEVFKLKQDDKKEKLKLSWETFGKGIEILNNTLQKTSGVHPDIAFGINEAGVMIASYLSFFKGRIKLGAIKTRAINDDGKRILEPIDYPKDVADPKCILLVDSEIKSGKSIKSIRDELRNKYPNARIIYAVLVGVTMDKNLKSVCDLGWELNMINEKGYKPDIVAYYIEKPGIEPPGGIR